MNNNDQLIEMDIIPVQMATKEMFQELRTCPIYEAVDNRIIRENAGVLSKKAFTFFDVSNTSQEFKNKYMTIKLQGISKILPITKDQASRKDNNQKTSIELLRLYESYKTLSKEEKKQLGHNFISLIDLENGLKVEPVLIERMASGEIFLEISSQNIDHELLSKIDQDIITLNLNELGLYEQNDEIAKKKSL